VPTILEIRGDPGCPEAVVAELGAKLIAEIDRIVADLIMIDIDDAIPQAADKPGTEGRATTQTAERERDQEGESPLGATPASPAGVSLYLD
jgi:hypothetical protein